MAAFLAPERHDAAGFVLRAYRPGDGAAMQEAKAGSYEHLRPWVTWAKPEETVEENEVLARQFHARYLLGEDFVIGVWSADQTELLGGTDFRVAGELRPADGVGEIGMWLRVDRAGRGLGTAVLVAMLRWGLSEAWPWHRLEWRCDSDNVASRRVAEKAGLALEGCPRQDVATAGGARRDTLVFAALQQDWTPPNGAARA